jgi:hypothetical protein
MYADGSEERVPIVKLPAKPPRYRYRKVSLDKARETAAAVPRHQLRLRSITSSAAPDEVLIESLLTRGKEFFDPKCREFNRTRIY